ncbi:MAG: PorP/SprF family type IX secretion system membrane protein [Bacteroidales bacterium]|nr:PorP/SprF family type IX secretion system membrane protein [Bacteroidales bacterium]
MKKYLAYILIFISLTAKAQDAQFSQYYSAPLLLSPCFAGTTNGIRAIANFRTQWYSAFNYGYNTGAVSLDHNLKAFNSGVGLVFVSDFAGSGALNREKIGLDYNYNIALGRGIYFRPGIELSYGYVGISDNFLFGSEMRDDNPVDDEIISSALVDHKSYFDASAGVMFFSQKYWLGGTLYHLMQPNESLSGTAENLPMKFLGFFGGKYDINGRLGRPDEESITYSIIYRAQEKFDQIDIGAYWYKKSFQIGLWYRGIPGFKKNEDESANQDAVILFAKYNTPKWGVGYSYDITVSRLFADTGGAHELSLFFIFLEDKEIKVRQKKLKVPCPRF